MRTSAILSLMLAALFGGVLATETNSAQAQRSGPCHLNEFTLGSGEEKLVATGCNIVGDVEVYLDGTYVRKYDDDPLSGLIVRCLNPSGCKIRAPWGAQVTFRGLRYDIFGVNSLIQKVLQNGCGSSCQTVDVEVVLSDTNKSLDVFPDGYGDIDFADALCILQIIAGIPGQQCQYRPQDDFTVSDVLLILQYMSGQFFP